MVAIVVAIAGMAAAMTARATEPPATSCHLRDRFAVPSYDLWTLSRFASGVNRLSRRRRAVVRGVIIAMFLVPLALEIAALLLRHL